MTERFRQLETLLETWPEGELLEELTRFLPNATFNLFFYHAAPQQNVNGDESDNKVG